jgi:hypothetical protein
MNEKRTSTLSIPLCILLFAASAVSSTLAAALSATPSTSAQAQAAPGAAARKIGAIKAINGTSITLTPDSGPEVGVIVQGGTRIVKIAPGEKNLKNATPVQLQDLQVGDRILVAGQPSDDAKSIAAATIVVMAHSDLEARHQQELQDWQKRGMGGLVGAVDTATGTVTISVSSLAGKKTVAVHTSNTTVIRRYAPDSVKFEDAKTSSLQEIKPGDQLRARGDRNADGTELAAEEIVTGVFRNVVGTINSVDASSGVVSVQDVLTKKAVVVKVAGGSELHKLPAEMAQRFAARLKGAAGIPGVPGVGGAGPGAAGTSASPAAGASGAPMSNAQGTPSGASPAGAGRSGGGMSAGGMGAGGMAVGMRLGGAPDFQQMLSFTPSVAVADLHKGDAVVILATEGTPTSASTVITLVSGVEPILQAAPSASQAMMLAPWSLGGAPAGGEGP